MKLKFAELWRTDGTIDRRTYAIAGLVGFAIKYNLDRLIAKDGFNRPWQLYNYWVMATNATAIGAPSRADAMFFATMVLSALPFIWIGVALTVRRLRSANLPPSLLVLFFLPFLNLFFFLFLSLAPAADQSTESRVDHIPRFWRFIPESRTGSAAAAILITAPIGVATLMLGPQVMGNYGWGIFVALPFAMGFAAALIYAIRSPRSLGESVLVACLSVVLLGGILLAIAVEGLMCLMMAVPIALPLAVMGGVFGYLVQRCSGRRARPEAAYLAVLLLFSPGVQWAEKIIAPKPPVYAVRSALEIDAPPEAVWKQVVAFTEIPQPKEWIFRAGVAYPIRAEMFGTGSGAERHCVFSTGAFVEPIQVWDEPRLLKFSVTSNPAPMEEWTPYSHIEPPHLHGFLVSNGGQFQLTALANGRTRLEGTTWYRHSLWPAQYWKLWSDNIIHQIHLRVLKHIRDEAESRPIS
jgi:Polyketide cyclase / dehydrase and lipid transport.